jgi:anti-anti-sigma regulatory factor
VCKFSGEIDFMNINEEIEHLKKLESGTTIILSFSEISYMDIDGIEIFDEVIEFFEENNLNLYFSGIHGRLEKIMNRTEFYHDFKKKGRVFETSSKALTHL